MDSQILQVAVVALIVAAALLRFCTHYLPAAWRKRIVALLARRGVDQEKAARLFNTKPGCGDGCASCNACDSGPSGPSGPSAPSSGGGSSSAPLKRVITLHVQR